MGRNYIIIDDDAEDQELLIETLREVEADSHFLSFYDCEDALDVLKTNVSDMPDLIFLDLNMPRLNGKRCLEELKKIARLKSVPVVIYSTSSRQDDVDETMKLGASYFLTKPNSYEDLRRAIQYLLSKKWTL